MHVYVFVFIAASASKQCLFKSCFFALRCSQVYHCFDALIGLQLIINVFFLPTSATESTEGKPIDDASRILSSSAMSFRSGQSPAANSATAAHQVQVEYPPQCELTNL